MVHSILNMSGSGSMPRRPKRTLGLVFVSRVGAQIAQVEQAQQPEHCVLLHIFEGTRALGVYEGVQSPVYLTSTLLWNRLPPLLHFVTRRTPVHIHIQMKGCDLESASSTLQLVNFCTCMPVFRPKHAPGHAVSCSMGAVLHRKHNNDAAAVGGPQSSVHSSGR